jgi:RHS repeat-associated protein
VTRLGQWVGRRDCRPDDLAGSLIREQQDISGLMYRRNRYYDPMTGQFTQSDPIGIAGGLNTYGFAEGDPVTYSDPFGLCKRDEEGTEDPECRAVITLLETTAKVADLSELARAELLYAANVYERFQGDVKFSDQPESLSGGSLPYFIGLTSPDQTSVRLNTAASGIDFALVAYHEAQHLSVGRGFRHDDNRKPGDLDPTDRMQAMVYNGLPRWLRDQATETRRYLQGWGAIP